jgi:hypothetical protein
VLRPFAHIKVHVRNLNRTIRNWQFQNNQIAYVATIKMSGDKPNVPITSRDPIVIERPYIGMNSNSLLISLETVSFRWTCWEKSLEFSASLGFGISGTLECPHA